MNKNQYQKLLKQKNTLIINMDLAKKLGLAEALIFSLILDFEAISDSEGWFPCTTEKLAEASTLTKFRQEAPLENLKAWNLIESKKGGDRNRRQLKINPHFDQILDKIFTSSSEKTEPLVVKKIDDKSASLLPQKACKIEPKAPTSQLQVFINKVKEKAGSNLKNYITLAKILTSIVEKTKSQKDFENSKAKDFVLEFCQIIDVEKQKEAIKTLNQLGNQNPK